MSRFKLHFGGLMGPLIILILVSVIAGSWHLSARRLEAFDSAASSSVSMDTNVIASALNVGKGSVTVPADGQVVQPAIPPIVTSVSAAAPAGVMTTQANAPPLNLTDPASAVPAPFPTLTGTNTPLVDPKSSQLSPNLPNVVQSIPPVPPVVPGVVVNSQPDSDLTPGLIRVDATSPAQKLALDATNPVLGTDARAPVLPVSEPSFPPALAPSTGDTTKPYVDSTKQSFQLQKYASLFDELNDLQMQLTDNVTHLRSLNNKIRSQYTPEYPLPLVELNAGY